MPAKWIAATTAAVVIGLLTAWFGLLVPAGVVALALAAAYVLLIFRNPDRGLWLLALVLPYERIGSVPAGFFTLKLGHLVCAFMLIAWGAVAVIKRSFRLVSDPLRIPLLLLLAASVLSLINALNMQRGIVLIVQLLIGFAVYLLVINFLSRRVLKGVLISLWVGAVVVALFGLYQFVGDYLGLPTSLTGLLPQYSGSQVFGFARIQSTSLEPLYFANYLLLPILTALAFSIGTRSRRRFWLVPLILLLLVVFVLTLARGAYLGLVAGVIAVAVAYWRTIITPRVVATVVASLAAVAMIAVILLQTTGGGKTNPLETFARQVGVAGKDVSSQQRLGSIAAAQQLVGLHPLIGLGIGNFGNYYQDPLTIPSPDRVVPQVVNNQTLETLVETGLFGLLALVLIWVVLADRSLRAYRASATNPTLRAAVVGSAAAVLAIFVQAQTFSAIYLLHVWFAVGLLVGSQNLVLLPKKAQPR